MQFIVNKSLTDNHLVEIENSLNQCKKAYFAVAFLKISGFNRLKTHLAGFLAKGGNITIITGQYFALTEPRALYALFNLFDQYPNSKLYLSKADLATCVFHPKLYMFQNSNSCKIISGSANLTEGGLITNKETSIAIDCSRNDIVWADANNYFQSLIKVENADEASLLVIQQYETFFEQQRQANKSVKAIPKKSKSQLAFNYNNFIRHFRNFDSAERQKNFKSKTADYKKAKIILDQIANNLNFTENEFRPLLDSLVGTKNTPRHWHSGSLFRLRKFVYPYYYEFRELVLYIKNHKNQPASIVFEKSKEMVAKIEGAAVNYVAEIMMTYNNENFANLNKNPITVLKEEGGVNLKAHSSSFNGADYEKYTLLIKEINSKLGLKNMLEADSFFNEIYWSL